MTTGAAPADAGTIADEVERHRRELTGYCYRMLGSGADAEDAVQETALRAWRSIDSFDGRASVRSWLYRIATNVCLDALRGRRRRGRSTDLGPVRTPDAPIGDLLPAGSWITPIPDERVIAPDADPADATVERESIRLAFVAALQHLPAKQRAALILCEVLKWQASEVATLLDTSVASVNSALQRARATLADLDADRRPAELTADELAVVERYADAFQRYDIDAIVGMLRDDVVLTMPPFDFWLQGPDHVAAWFLGQGSGCRGSRLVPVAANGAPAFGSYKSDPAGGHMPFAIQVLDVDGGRIVGHHNFLDPDLFAVFGLPEHLDDETAEPDQGE